MTYNIQTVKNILNTFFDEHVHLSDSSYINGEHFVTNREFFELQNHFINLCRQFEINMKLDTSITSNHILQNIYLRHPNHAYRAVDYQFNFLYHLAEYYGENLNLYELIDTFIERYKHELTGADLVITDSGATRCKTNIRFALKALRELGLVVNHKEEKRSWSPSILGLVALLNIRYDTQIERKDYCKTPGTLKSMDMWNRKIAPEYTYDRTLMDSLLHLTGDPLNFYTYLSHQKDDALTKSEKKLLESIITRYINFTQEGLIITRNGVKKSDTFDKKSKKFAAQIFAINKENEEFLQKLFAHFRKRKQRGEAA